MPNSCYQHIKIKFNFSNSSVFGFLSENSVIKRDSTLMPCSNIIKIDTPGGVRVNHSLLPLLSYISIEYNINMNKRLN